MLVSGGSLTTVMKTPSGRAAFQGSAQILQKVLRLGFPCCVTATEWLLIVERCEAIEFAHDFQAGAGLSFGL